MAPAAVTCGGVLLNSLTALAEAGSPKSPTASQVGLQRFTWSAPVLGTEATFIILHEDPEAASRVKNLVLAELRQVETVLSLYHPDSDLCRLNRTGFLSHPHPWMVEVLGQAQRLAEQTGGAFDVTVQPLWDLYAAAKAAGRFASPEEIKQVRQKVDWRKLSVSRHQVRLNGQGMAVTLNALAQGFAADRVLAVLRRHSIGHALVNTGEIGALGRKEGGKLWEVGIQHPRVPEAYIGLARLADCCMATSGDYATRFTDDYRSNHIFNPATGQSPRELASATVVARTGLEADALATAVLVLGSEKGLNLLQSYSGAEAFLVLKDGLTRRTPGFPLV